MVKMTNFVEKIKKMFRSKKVILIVCLVIVFCIICVFYLAQFKTSNDSTNYDTVEVEYSTTLENKLKSVISKISNAGQVDVLVTLESGYEYEYATEETTKTTSSSSGQVTSTTSSMVIVSGSPVIVKQIYPKVKGVVVVASGAKDAFVRMSIINAVVTSLEIDQSNIIVLY